MCGIHVADALLWLADSEPVSIYAIGGPVTASGPSSLHKVHAVIAFRSGLKASFVSGDVGADDRLSKFSLQVYTGKGSAVAYNRLKDLDVTNLPDLLPVHAPSENFGDVMRAFLACVTENRPSPIPPEEGLKATRLIVRMIESIRCGKPVPWL